MRKRAMRRSTVLTMVLALLLGLVQPAIGTGVAAADPLPEPLNLVENGGFEEGSLSRWNTGGSSKFSVTDEVYHSGDYGMKISSSNQEYQGLKNTVSLNTNTDYTLSFFAKGTGGSYFKVLASDESTIKEGMTSSSEDWRNYTLDFNSGDNSTIIIYVSDIKGEAYFDDFTIEAPQPAEVPSASNVRITGDFRVTGVLSGSYDYSHPSEISQGYTVLKWYQAEAEDGEYQPIAGATGTSYSLKDTEAGKYIKLQVTPIDITGIAGEAVWSEAAGPVADPDKADALNYQILLAKELRDHSVKGDEIGQYPESDWNEYESAIAAAETVAADPASDEAVLAAAVSALKQAMEKFDKTRITVPSTFNNFITVSGDELMDGDEEFRFISYNYPGALFNEDEQGGIVPTVFEQEDAIRTIQQVGGKVFRTYSLTVRDKNDAPNAIRHIDGPATINEEAFRSMDKLLELANQYGVRVIIPFIDNWDWPPGGITDFAAFRGKQRLEFYTDPQLIEDFELVMDQVLNHINVYTGVRYKDDPAIMAWETGNELMTAPAWMSRIAAYYKQINSNQLLISGNQMDLPHNYTNITEAALNDPNIDIVKSHYYSGNYAARVKEDKAKATGKKPFLVGEFGFKKTKEVEAMLDAVIENDVSGAMIWSLRPHSAQGGYIRHDEMEVDGLLYRPYHWPGVPSGDYYEASSVIQVMREKAYEIQGLEVPPMPAPEPAPELFRSDSVSALRWKGATGASSYTIERAESVSGPWLTIAEDVLDDVAPGEVMYSDLTAQTGKDYYYRVKGVNTGGESAWSEVMGPVTARYVLTDDLRNTSKQYYYDDASVVYRTPSELVSFSVNAELSSGAAGGFKFYASEDGISFEELTVLQSGNTYTWNHENSQEHYSLLKIEYPDGNKNFGTIRTVSLEYLGDGSLLKPVQPLVKDGVLVDELNDYSFIFSKDGDLEFDRDNQEQAGGDESRLMLGQDGGEAYVVYRSLGEMHSFKVETYSEEEQGGSFSFYGSEDGVTYSALQVEKDTLGGFWVKTNYSLQHMPGNIKFLKIVYPQQANSGFPQISKVQIGVGEGSISFPEELPAYMIEDGEHYGGEELLLGRTYSVEADGGSLHLGLNRTEKAGGEYALKVDYNLGTADQVGFGKELQPEERSAYDTLQFWIKPDGSERRIQLLLENERGEKWTKEVTVSGIEPVYINLPLGDFAEDGLIEHFSFFIKSGSAQASGTLTIDDLKFIQTRVIDSFDAYASEQEFAKRYSRKNPANNLQLSRSGDVKADGDYALKMDYDFGGDGYAGVITSLPNVDWSAYDTVKLWVQPDASDVKLSVQVRQGSLEYMEASVQVDGGSGPQWIEIPFSEFDYPSWYGGSGTLNPRHIVEFNLYLGQVSAQTGTLFIDEIQLVNNANPGTDPGTDPGTNPGTNPGTGSGVTGMVTPNPSQPVQSDKTEVTSGAVALNTPEQEEVTLNLKPEDVAKAMTGFTGKVFNITAALSEKTNKLSLTLPLQQLASSVEGIELDLGLASFNLQKQLWASNTGAAASDLTLTLNRVERTDLPSGIQQKAASALQFRLSVNGEAVESLAGKSVKIAIPYKLQPGQQANQVIVYHVNEQGQYEVIKRASYDASTGLIEFISKQQGILAVAVVTVSFQDTLGWAWASDAIQSLAAKEIVQGDGAGQFSPERSITRAEFVMMLAGALDLPESSTVGTFKDVADHAWYADAIARAALAGIVQGKSDGSFGVNETISRQEMAVMLARAVQAAGISHETPSAAPFTDQEAISGYARAAVLELRKGGLIQGIEGKFEPNQAVNRAQAATVVYRLLEMMD